MKALAVRTPHDQPQVERTTGVSAVEYRITGSRQSVMWAIEHIFDAYDPHGYGTRVHELVMGGDGLYVARMSRSKSCD